MTKINNINTFSKEIKNNFLFQSIAFLFICGCSSVSIIGYVGGYDDYKISETEYEVSFQGTSFTNPVQIEQYLLRRSAEIAYLNHFEYFIVSEESDRECRKCSIERQIHHRFGDTSNTTFYYGMLWKIKLIEKSKTNEFKEAKNVAEILKNLEVDLKSIK